MTLRLGQLPDRTPVRMSLSVDPELASAAGETEAIEEGAAALLDHARHERVDVHAPDLPAKRPLESTLPNRRSNGRYGRTGPRGPSAEPLRATGPVRPRGAVGTNEPANQFVPIAHLAGPCVSATRGMAGGRRHPSVVSSSVVSAASADSPSSPASSPALCSSISA